MDDAAKKTTLRMIPYGIYILTADDGKGNVGAATVNWVTQSSFAPPLLVVGVKADSGAHTVVKGTGKFVLNMLGKDGKGAAFTFFKPAKVEDGKLNGFTYRLASNGCAVLDIAIGAVECVVKEVLEMGRPQRGGGRGDGSAPDESPRRSHGCRDPGDEGPRG